MLMQPFNELKLKLTLKSVSPLLIKEGRYTDDDKKKWSANDEVVKNRMPNVIPISRATGEEIKQAVLQPNPLAAVGKLPFFVPGTSLRGAWRAHLERILRTLDPPATPRVCDPLEGDEKQDNASCSRVLALRQDTFVPYRVACPVCRLFGCTKQGSRLSITDGEFDRNTPPKLVQREHVAIDRRTGRVGGAPLKFFALDNAEFTVTIELRNFELSHVLLMGLLLTDLAQANLAVGSGKNKGYGRIKAAGAAINLTYFGLEPPPDFKLRGVAEHPSSETAEWFASRYGVAPAQDAPELKPVEKWEQPNEWRWRRNIEYGDFEQAWRKIKMQWKSVGTLAGRAGAA